MPCPHNEISIVQRSQQQSAIAAAAYQSGEKLFCEYDQQVKHYPEKRGIVHNEILLPPNAPQEYLAHAAGGALYATGCRILLFKCQRNRCGPHYVLQMDSVQLYPVDHPTGSAGDVVYHADV